MLADQKFTDEELIAAREKLELKDKFAKLMQQVPERYRLSSFGTLKYHPKIRLPKEVWQQKFDSLDELTKTDPHQNIFICGPAGTGKTTLAAAIFYRLASLEAHLQMKWKGQTALFWLDTATWADQAVSHKFGNGVRPAITTQSFRVTYPRAIFMDDFDKVGDNVHKFETVMSFINAAYHSSHTQIVVTSNLTQSDFQERYGDYIFRRIDEDGNAAIFDMFEEPKSEGESKTIPDPPK